MATREERAREIQEVVETLLQLPWKEQLGAVMLWFKDLSKGQQAYICRIVGRSLDFRRLPKAERWMERRLEKDFSRPPKQVAVECQRYLGFPERMLPGLINAAQRVKDRLHKRYTRMGWFLPERPPKQKRRKKTESAPESPWHAP